MAKAHVTEFVKDTFLKEGYCQTRDKRHVVLDGYFPGNEYCFHVKIKEPGREEAFLTYREDGRYRVDGEPGAFDLITEDSPPITRYKVEVETSKGRFAMNRYYSLLSELLNDMAKNFDIKEEAISSIKIHFIGE